MKFIILILLFLFTLNCSLNKVSNSHGSRFVNTKYDKIILNKSNKNDVRKIMGPPSSVSKFKDTWFDIERKKENQSLFKLGKKKIATNDIVILEFNTLSIVTKKNLLNLENMNDIKIAEKITEKKFSQNNLLYEVLASLREKVNAPSRRDK